MILDESKILIRTKFIKKLKYLSRGLNDIRVLEEMLKYYNNSEKYISDLEIENFRLSLENENLKKQNIDYFISGTDAIGWLQSIMIKQLKKCSTKTK